MIVLTPGLEVLILSGILISIKSSFTMIFLISIKDKVFGQLLRLILLFIKFI